MWVAFTELILYTREYVLYLHVQTFNSRLGNILSKVSHIQTFY